MAKREIERAVTQSIIDRLTDLDRGTGDPHMSFMESVRAYKASVQRDLEWVLNTRQTPEPAPEQLEELRRSVYHYGLPDLTSLDRDSRHARDMLLRRVEGAIANFEPRLEDGRVSVVEQEGENFRRELRFYLEGTLRMDPSPEHVVFDTVLHISSGEYDIEGQRSA
ncbi:MAG TPA: type VI secretion system baseplate subunit TssE [Gemmatimonadaceae bacterium]|nr:type VI secretion system baseplate subunit TssE [Gemmatimonadaceae bacterium]